jgi:hypothetical protein
MYVTALIIPIGIAVGTKQDMQIRVPLQIAIMSWHHVHEWFTRLKDDWHILVILLICGPQLVSRDGHIIGNMLI